MFMLFGFMFPIIFVMVFGMIIFQFVTGIGTWHKNNLNIPLRRSRLSGKMETTCPDRRKPL